MHPEELKVVIGVPFVSYTSGWETRYMGLLKALSRHIKLRILIPGSGRALAGELPAASICGDSFSWKPSTQEPSVLTQLMCLKNTSINPYYQFSHTLSKRVTADLHSSKCALYFGKETLKFYGTRDPSQAIICDFCDSYERQWKNAIRRARRLENKFRYSLKLIYELRSFRHIRREGLYPLAITAEDARWIHKRLARAVTVVPNGVDVQPQQSERADCERKQASRKIAFLGDLVHPPNIESIRYCAQRIWPSLRRAFPDAQFCIFGRNPNLALFAELRKTNGIRVVGEVPDVTPYLESSAVLLAPMFSGSGMRNKILESLACGTPVVTNKEGANGIRLISGLHGYVVEGEQDLTHAVCRLLTDTEAAYRSKMEACLNLAAEYSWERSSEIIRCLLDDILGND